MRFISLFITLLVILSLAFLFNNCQSEGNIQKAQYIANGHKLYKVHCQNCHGVDGKGLGKLYPPLDDQQFYLDHQEQLACFIKYGIQLPIKVHGIEYNGKMPPNPKLTNIDIAYLITYITTQFGKNVQHTSKEAVINQLEKCK